ncbi:L-asparagine oxygenase [Streptomyces scabiei]|uniref:L-asparagine oxygenase n=1 Tax=Streptomyces scabiei TaxID=1930 RepID=A0A124C333_STRSC|nr:L-asparagine oxygenase [Streptomyces scabiei]
MLLCLRLDHEGTAELRTSCARRVLPLLTPRSREALGRPEYVTEAPPSFGPAGEGTAHRITLHGRSAFTPRYDGRDRWLQRTFAFSDLRRSRDHRPGDGTVLVK